MYPNLVFSSQTLTSVFSWHTLSCCHKLPRSVCASLTSVTAYSQAFYTWRTAVVDLEINMLRQKLILHHTSTRSTAGSGTSATSSECSIETAHVLPSLSVELKLATSAIQTGGEGCSFMLLEQPPSAPEVGLVAQLPRTVLQKQAREKSNPVCRYLAAPYDTHATLKMCCMRTPSCGQRGRGRERRGGHSTIQHYHPTRSTTLLNTTSQ